MSKPKTARLFRRGKRTTSKNPTGLRYQPLDYDGGYTFSVGTAYGQLNQVLDLAAQDPQNSKSYMHAADRWLYVISKLEEEAEEPHQTIGFRVNRREEEDDSTENHEQA